MRLLRLNPANPFDKRIYSELCNNIETLMHDIVGFAGTNTTLMRLREVWPCSRIFQLAPGSEFVFLPINDMLNAEPDNASESSLDEFWHEKSFSSSYIEWFARFSEVGSLAWLKTASNGGSSYQAAILWAHNEHVFGPVVRWSGDEPEWSEMPINRALRSLGVPSTDQRDEFDIFGLAAYRNYQDLISRAKEVSIAASTQSG